MTLVCGVAPAGVDGVTRYGCHIFHTKYDRVKEYVQQYSDWVPYEHRVIAKVAPVLYILLVSSNGNYWFPIHPKASFSRPKTLMEM